MQPNITLPKTPKEQQLIMILNQTGTNNPTAQIIKNTTGCEVILFRYNTGVYIIQLDGYTGDIMGKSQVTTSTYVEGISYSGRPTNYNEVRIATWDIDTKTNADDLLFDAPFTLTIFN